MRLEPSVFIAIFGVADEGLSLNANQSDIIAFTSLLAHRNILLVSKSPIYKFTQRGSVKKSHSKWGPTFSLIISLFYYYFTLFHLFI